MPRHLRPRKTRQNYTSLFQDEDEQENISGPSRQVPDEQQEEDGASDFTPPLVEEAANTDEGDDIGDPASLRDGIGVEGESSCCLRKTKNIGIDTAKAKRKQKAKATHNLNSPDPAATPDPATRRSTAPTVTPTTSTRHVLPNPNIHHRHRPVPLFSGPTATASLAPMSTSTSTSAVMLRVERLRHAPLLFAPNEIVPTNAYASSPLLTRRVGKAWGMGIGVGPVWQIVEDLGWFREAEKLKPSATLEQQVMGEAAVVEPTSEQEPVYDERRRRPRVYADVAPPEGWADPLRIECVSTFHS